MTTIATTSQPATSSSLKRLLTDHPLVAYFVIAFAGAWIVFLPLLLARNGLGLLPFSLPVVPFQTIGAFAGPTLAAFIVTAATSGKAGLRQLLRRIVQWRVGVGWYLLALLGYPLIYVGSGIITLGIASLPTLLAQWSLFFTVYLSYLVVNLISTIGEEMGWVGYALPNLQQRIAPLLSAVTLGVLWALWHLPAFFVTGGLGPFSIVGFALFVVLGVGVRITWTWIFNQTKGSVIIIALLHAALNGTTVALPHRLPMIPPTATLLFIGLIVVVFPVLILILTRGRLSYRPGHEAMPVEEPQPTEVPMANA
jgi:membrane protease YdiL (CAAX protease family)